jgi:hypothetical protein
MLVMWQYTYDTRHQSQHIDTPANLDSLLDRLHQQASTDHYPNAVHIYAGNHYPQHAHAEGDRWIPDNPGDGPQPQLMLVIGADDTPLSWYDLGGHEHTSLSPHPVPQPEPREFFEFFYGGQESYAPESSLIPHQQAREAARQFLTNNGKRPANITWRTDDTG